MSFEQIPHAHFPFDESPWIKHFQDADAGNRRARLSMAGGADAAGHDAFARHIMNAATGENPFLNYQGPFGEGEQGHQVVPPHPPQLYQEYFGNHVAPGGVPGQGPFADPSRKINPGASRPDGSVNGPPGSGGMVSTTPMNPRNRY